MFLVKAYGFEAGIRLIYVKVTLCCSPFVYLQPKSCEHITSFATNWRSLYQSFLKSCNAKRSNYFTRAGNTVVSSSTVARSLCIPCGCESSDLAFGYKFTLNDSSSTLLLKKVSEVCYFNWRVWGQIKQRGETGLWSIKGWDEHARVFNWMN
jgi:hypothetical protein